MALRIKVDRSVPLGAQARVATWCESEISGLVEIPESDKFHWYGWATISGVVSAIIAAIILVLELQPDHTISAEKRHLDTDRLLAVTKDALLRRRIVDIQIREVVGIDEPNKASGDFYRINIVNTFNNSDYVVSVINDGEAYVLRLG